MVFERDSEIDAPFNMALATLKRLDIILTDIKNLDCMYLHDTAEKQKAFITLVKQFFFNAIPLLSEEDIEKYQEEILKIELRKQSVVSGGVQSIRYTYDKKVNNRFSEILIELQTTLKKFFMPKGSDPSSAVSNF